MATPDYSPFREIVSSSGPFRSVPLNSHHHRERLIGRIGSKFNLSRAPWQNAMALILCSISKTGIKQKLNFSSYALYDADYRNKGIKMATSMARQRE